MDTADPSTSAPSRSTRRALPLLLLAAAALVVGWLVAPHPVPLYDGVGMPDEAYRFAVPPAGYRATPPVSAAQTEIALVGGISCCEIEARSAEQGPQVSVYVPRGGLRAPGNGNLTVAAQPLPPDGPVPVAKAKFEGNLYRLTTRGPGGPATLTPDGARATLQLRALNGNTPEPRLWYRSDPAAAWRQLPTGKVGFDIYESQFVGAGDYVLVRPAGGSGSTVKVLLGILAIPALLVIALVVLRLRGGPPDDDDEDDEDDDERDDEDDEDDEPRGGRRRAGGPPGSGPGA